MRTDEEQDIKNALKQDIKQALKKEEKPLHIHPEADPQPRKGLSARRTNLIIVLAASMASLVLFTGYCMFIKELIDLFQGPGSRMDAPALSWDDSMGDIPRPKGGHDIIGWSDGSEPGSKEAKEAMEFQKEIAIKQAKAEQSIEERSLTLKKTGVGEHRAPYAILIDKTGREQVCRVGDRIMDASVTSIFPGSVILNVEGQRVELTAESSNNRDGAGALVEYVGETDPSHAANLSADFADNKDRLLGQTRLKRDASGYTLLSEDSGSPLSYAGIRSGDIICSINGISLKTRKGIVKAYESITNLSSVNVEFERNGTVMTADIALR
jgi:type II secretory pathway component PulC